MWGTDYTNAKGKWRTSPIEDPPDQNYTAIAFEVTLKDGGSHNHRCKTASRAVTSHG